LYYDIRVDDKSLQDPTGFCVDEKELMSELTNTLEENGFKKNEVDDFRMYWTHKMPIAKNYCVFPQENQELSTVAKLIISKPINVSMRRLGFIIVPQKNIPKINRKFLSTPKMAWHSTFREPASIPEVRIREWGVGFLTF
jgi:hypothetical protein